MKASTLSSRAFLSVLALLATVSTFLISCSHVNEAVCRPNDRVAEMRALRVSEAAQDAAKAHHAHDHRLLGINGYVLDVPGVSASVAKRSGVRPIEGTSDALCSREQGELIENARRYAKAYNQKMASYSH